jgi:hypothetical protein
MIMIMMIICYVLSSMYTLASDIILHVITNKIYYYKTSYLCFSFFTHDVFSLCTGLIHYLACEICWLKH